RSYNSAAMVSAGVALNDECIIRFVMNIEAGFGNPTWPGYGFAIDQISLTGIQIQELGNWTTINNALVGTNVPFVAKPNGQYAYRVRAFADSAWQGYGTGGITTVTPVSLSGFEVE